MRVFLCVISIGIIACLASGTPVDQKAGNVNAEPDNNDQMLSLGSDLIRYRKSYGSGGSYIPSPPCPKNYLFSCGPKLSPVPCAPGSSYSSGSAGAYTAPVPTYVAAPLGFTFTGALPNFHKN